jgi:hypothetical protein
MDQFDRAPITASTLNLGEALPNIFFIEN